MGMGMMQAATVAPFQQQIQPMQQQQPGYIQQQSVQPQYMQQAQSQPMANGLAGQYVCPVHGAVGLPQFNAAGVPMCPMGDQVMQFRSAGSNNLTLAAGG